MDGDRLLLIQHREHRTGRSYWLLPGGGREAGESETGCVRREMAEETGLTVEVEALVLDEPAEPAGYYARRKIYRCRPEPGEAAPGYEPEPEAAAVYGIAAVTWIDLRDPAGWDAAIVAEPITYPLLGRLRRALGYSG